MNKLAALISALVFSGSAVAADIFACRVDRYEFDSKGSLVMYEANPLHYVQSKEAEFFRSLGSFTSELSLDGITFIAMTSDGSDNRSYSYILKFEDTKLGVSSSIVSMTMSLEELIEKKKSAENQYADRLQYMKNHILYFLSCPLQTGQNP